MAYWQWGEPTAPHLVVCAHGLSRQGRDFDVLARALLARAAAQGQALFDYSVQRARALHAQVATGIFGADMQVALVNDGPVTIWLDTDQVG